MASATRQTQEGERGEGRNAGERKRAGCRDEHYLADRNWQVIGIEAATAGAEARFSGTGACELAVYIPDQDATASASFQIRLATGTSQTAVVDESTVDGWVLLAAWQSGGSTGSPPVEIAVGNDTGSDTDTLGLGPVVSLCAG